jgi:hypothetical protein
LSIVTTRHVFQFVLHNKRLLRNRQTVTNTQGYANYLDIYIYIYHILK